MIEITTYRNDAPIFRRFVDVGTHDLHTGIMARYDFDQDTETRRPGPLDVRPCHFFGDTVTYLVNRWTRTRESGDTEVAIPSCVRGVKPLPLAVGLC